ncbi:hypothetical protein [Oceanicoccus sp. KOV_DT_Chl]|uniref:hypothetical protein n=1 Tax=Oceanicoccus sp. KOV_DT_Chl TaxID=1904639 RepID=UPI00190E7841|nr:hypothetical protein [Oceanicoccus sp. KOV_DT_Chl]
MKDYIVSMLIVFSLLASAVASADARERAKRIHERLTGTVPTDAMLDRMETEVVGGDAVTAALYAMDGAPAPSPVAANGHFYNVVVKNWASPWTNEARDITVPLNDYSATVIGIVRDSDSIDFREILYGDIIYKGNTGSVAGLNQAFSEDNNAHYEQLEELAVNLGDDNVLVRSTQSSGSLPASAVAGVMTTRAAASAFFIDGTNRAMFRFTLLNHLCMDLEQLKDTSRPTDRIRQDVSRSPGLDSTLFLNQCVGCHSGMDPMAQAFAYYEYYPSMADRPDLTEDERRENGHLVYNNNGQVQNKYHINENNFKPGYITPNDHWTNYWRLGDNSSRIGWMNPATNSSSIDMAINPAYSEGDGAASMGQELANSQAFAVCQVKKVFRAVCHREPAEDDRTDFDDLVSDFLADYNMKMNFARVAASCTQHL